MRAFDPTLRAAGVTQLIGDLDERKSLSRLSGLAHAILHSALPPAAGEDDPRTRHLLAVLAQGRMRPRRLVYISTSGVYGDCRGEWVSEERPTNPQSARARRRVAAERRLRRAGRRGLAVSILRAPGIYAADRLPLERLCRGEPTLIREEDSYTNHIHAEDLAQACALALERGRPNRAYNVCDDSELAMGDWFDLLADAFALPPPPRVSREEARRRLSPLLLSFLDESRRLVNARAKRELGLRLRYPTVVEGIADALEKSRCSG